GLCSRMVSIMSSMSRWVWAERISLAGTGSEIFLSTGCPRRATFKIAIGSPRGRIVAQGSRALERGQHSGPARIVERGLEGRIELGAIVETAVALANPLADLLERPAHRDEIDHGHASPSAPQHRYPPRPSLLLPA